MRKLEANYIYKKSSFRREPIFVPWIQSAHVKTSYGFDVLQGRKREETVPDQGFGGD